MIGLIAAATLATLKPGECLPPRPNGQTVCLTKSGRLEVFEVPLYWRPSLWSFGSGETVHPDYDRDLLWRWHQSCLGDKDTRECPRPDPKKFRKPLRVPGSVALDRCAPQGSGRGGQDRTRHGRPFFTLPYAPTNPAQ